MAKKDKKVVVLMALRKHSPMTLSALLEVLGPEFVERTTRRWLNEMVNEGKVKKIGQKRSTCYQVISLPSERPSFFNMGSSSSVKAIDYVQQPLFKRSPVAYNHQWLENYLPNTTFYLSPSQRKSMSIEGQRGIDNNSAGTYAKKIYHRLLIDLSYNSSRLEGNTYSLLDTERLIFEGAAAADKLDEEKIMILNHKEAIRHLVDSAPKILIDFNEICTLHFLLSDGLITTQYSGKIRDFGVRIGGSTYVPLENKIELDQLLHLICQKAQKIHDPFECSLFLLTQIAYLQPFLDVNKRTSRLSANIPLIKHNLVPLSFNDVEKEDYNSAMISIYELNDVTPLAELYTFSYLRSCQLYDVSVEVVGYDEIRVQYRQARRDIIRHIITHRLTNVVIDEYLQQQAEKISKEHRERFIKTVKEDLAEISLHRIAGLGVTAKQLEAWLIRSKEEK